jgi:hypothetical protein
MERDKLKDAEGESPTSECKGTLPVRTGLQAGASLRSLPPGFGDLRVGQGTGDTAFCQSGLPPP